MVDGVRAGVSLKAYSTLRAGGAAERFAIARDVEQLAALVGAETTQPTVLGWGSNVLPSDAGVPGLTIVNQARQIEIEPEGLVMADSGCGFQELFMKTAQASLAGLEFAVGIPGTLGGALVSNAGAYRSCISEFLTELEMVIDGERQWVAPAWMQFAYRDSVLRSQPPPAATILRVRMRLPRGNPKWIYDEARKYQRARISKQPPHPSAGSFFKNVNDEALAAALPGLPDALRDAGVVPAGYLIEAVGLKGFRLGGAGFGRRHANFIVNLDKATATEIRDLARLGRARVAARFGVELEEEVLYLGDWSSYAA